MLCVLLLAGCSAGRDATPSGGPRDGGNIAGMDAGPNAGTLMMDACRQWKTAWCQFIEDCGGGSVSGCVEREGAFCPDIVARVAAGTLAMDRSSLPACVTEMAAMACWGDYYGVVKPEACVAFLHGTREGNCDATATVNECAPGTYCNGGICPPYCAPYAARGDRVDSQFGQACAPGDYGRPSGFSNYCAPLGTDYAPCRSQGYDCAAGYFCSGQDGECRPQREPGETCTETERCVRGSVCRAATHRCEPRANVGEACAPNECLGSAWCDETGHCQAALPPGASCARPDGGGQPPRCAGRECDHDVCPAPCSNTRNDCGAQRCVGGYCVNSGDRCG